MTISIKQLQKLLKSRERNILGHEQGTKSAVLLPLIEKDHAWYVLFEVRARHLNRQPGEVCFPGGRVDREDSNEEQTAIRETCEELNLRPDEVEILGPLDIMSNSFPFYIYPYAGMIKKAEEAIRPNPEEVDKVFSVPLDWLMTSKPEIHYIDLTVNPPEDFPFHLIPNGRDYNWRQRKIPEYFYIYQDYVIWGLTARILHHFITLMGHDDRD